MLNQKQTYVDVIIEDSSDSEEYPDRNSSNFSPSVKKIISLVIAFLLKLRVVYNISARAVILLLRFFKFLLGVIGTSFGVSELRNGVHFPQSLPGCYSFLDLKQLHIRSMLCVQHVICSMIQTHKRSYREHHEDKYQQSVLL